MMVLGWGLEKNRIMSPDVDVADPVAMGRRMEHQASPFPYQSSLLGMLLSVAILALVMLASTTASAWGSFGIEPGSVTTTAVERDGTIDTQAGSHPYALSDPGS